MPRPSIRSGLIPAGAAIVLHQSPGRLSVHVAPLEPQSVLGHGPKERALGVVGDARRLDVGQHSPGRIQQDLPALLVSLLRDLQVVLHPVILQMAHARPNQRRDPAAGDKERRNQCEIPQPLERVRGNHLQAAQSPAWS